MRGTRKRNAFTPEQMDILSANQFTESITTTRISYTNEFKEIFWQKYTAGEHVKDIFESLGYDTDILGEGRIYNFSHVFSQKMQKVGDDLSKQSKISSKATNAAVISMQHEITYLRQQIDFLKKITALDNNPKV